MSIYARMVLVALVLLACVMGLWKAFTLGQLEERSQWVVKLAAEKTIAEAKANRLAARQAQIRAQTEKENADALNTLAKKAADLDRRDRAAGGLRVSADICAGFAGKASGGAAGSNAPAPATVQLPAATERFLYELANRADEIVEQARTCQAFICRNGLYPGCTE